MSKRAERAKALAATEWADRAKGGYYTVTDMRNTKPWHDRIDFYVSGFTADGELLLKTWHVGEHSMRTECECWRRRGATERKV